MPAIPLEVLLANVEGMRRLAQGLVRDPAGADDVAQEAVLVALEKPPRHSRNLRGWLFGIVRNVARDYRRSAARRAHYERTLPPRPEAPDPLDCAVQVAEQKRLLDAVHALPEPYRSAIWRRYFDDRTPRAIAREDGVSVETVHTRLKRARAMLRARLDAAHGGDRRAWALVLAPWTMSKASAGLTAWWGGVLVTAKTKSVALAVLVLLAAGGVGWMLSADLRSDPRASLALASDANGGGAAGGPILAGLGRADLGSEIRPGHVTRAQGHVVDEAERPLGGVEIRVGELEAEDLTGMRFAARSRDDGSFAFTFPSDAMALRVAATTVGRLDALARVHRDDADPLLLRLPAAPAYVFRFLDAETDRPLSGVRCETVRTAGELIWVRTLRTDHEGLVTLPSPTADEMDGRFPVRITHPGYRPLLELARPRRALGFGTAAQPRDVYLYPAPKIVIEVRDPEGSPLAGARVRAWAGHPGPATTAAEWSMTADGRWGDRGVDGVVLGDVLTDEAGNVVLDAGPRGRSCFAHATADGLAGLAVWESTSREEDAHVVIAMDPAVDVVGRVTDDAGAPAVGARVAVTPWIEAERLRKGMRLLSLPDEVARLFRTLTDEDGWYELREVQVPPPPAELHVQTHRGDLGHAFAPIPAPAGAGNAVRVDLVIESRHHVLEVLVVDAEDAPVAGALVRFANFLPGRLTDEAGRARLVLYQPLGEVVEAVVRAFKHGHANGTAPVTTTNEVVRIVLERPRSLRGRVVDADGRPQAAYVDVYAPETADLPQAERRRILGPTHYGRARAGVSGWFLVEDLPPGPYYVAFWYTTRREGQHHVVRGEQVVGEPGPVALRLPESEPARQFAGAVQGTLVDEDGQVLTRYSVGLRALHPGLVAASPILQGRRFRFEEVPPGEWTLTASTVDGSLQAEVPVLVRPDLTADLRVVLARTPTAQIRLVDEAGEGLAGRYVLLYREGRSSESGRYLTGSDGRFLVKGLLAGRYRARICGGADEAPRCTPETHFHLPADGHADLVLTAKRAGTLVLTLDDERFLPYAPAWWNSTSPEKERSSLSRAVVRTPAGEELWEVGIFHGRKAFDYPLSAGSYDLQISTHEDGSFRTSFSIQVGQTTIVPILLEK